MRIRFTRELDLVGGQIRLGKVVGDWRCNAKHPVFSRIIAVAFKAPDRIAMFHGHAVGIAKVVSNPIHLRGQIDIFGADRPSQNRSRDDAQQEQNDNHFYDCKTPFVSFVLIHYPCMV